jgi:hypothetical protein
MYHRKKIHQIQGNNNLRKKMVENQHTTMCWAWLSMNCCTHFWQSSLHTCVSTKSSIELGSCTRIIACKIKILSVKYIYKKTNNKENQCNTKNPTIFFACETKGTWPLMCVVTEPWTNWFRFSTSDCEHHVKLLNVMCWMYSTHIASETYGGLKSFKITTSFQPRSSFYFIYCFAFFGASYQKLLNLYGTN